MTLCARGCCWTPWQACAHQRACACHWTDTPRNEPRGSDSSPVRRPTEDQAIRNVMNAQRRK